MTGRQAIAMFMAFAGAYFLSALLRAVTATLAPAFSVELGLRAADLGLLAGAYFLGFSLLQLPLGAALDRFGSKRVLLVLLAVAAAGCVAFAAAEGLQTLFAARMLIGMGVSACLMAPLTAYRRFYSPADQLRANSWMLMTGSLGMLASTLPVQWLLPLIGWRGLFVVLAAGLMLAAAAIALVVPRDSPAVAGGASTRHGGYRQVFRHPAFVRSAPLGFFVYGGLIAVQSLWAGPWLTRVAGQTPAEAAQGLFLVNACMLLAFMAWGIVMPKLAGSGIKAEALMLWGLPLCLVVMAAVVVVPEPAGAGAWAFWCVSCTVVCLSQPAVGQAFEQHAAGRALSAFNLVIFSGVFGIQWSIGLLIDSAVARGHDEAFAFRLALAVFWSLSSCSYLWFVLWSRKGTVRRG